MDASACNLSFRYPECQKGQFHIGEALSLICLEPKCLKNCVICGICYSQQHKDHKIKPLKLIINNSRKYIQLSTPLNIDGQQIKEMISQQRKSILSKYEQYQKFIINNINNAKQSINSLYTKITEIIDLKSSNKQQIIRALDQIKEQEIQNDKFVSLMTKLIAAIPLQDQGQNIQTSSSQIKNSITMISKEIQTKFNTQTLKIKKSADQFSNLIKKLSLNPGLFDSHISFTFSTELKHNDVTVLSDKCVKSTQSYNYHFGLMEPSINQKGDKKISVSFLIKQSDNNWVAVGLCQKDAVKDKLFQFNYGNIGHGGYLISSNGGSWSSIDATKNGVINSFQFAKGDIINVEYDPENKKVTFIKKGTDSKYTLEVEPTQQDSLHLCCLFYYTNDQIEYLGYCDDL